AGLVFLPVMADASWKPQGRENPSLRILGLLAVTIGLPFFLFSSTSLLGLVSYPFVIEPVLTMENQVLLWSIGFGLFVATCAGAAVYSLYLNGAPVAAKSLAAPAADDPPTAGRMAMWLFLAALGSVILLATTNHITRDIASIPFLWVLPLSLYLLSFVLCF